MNKKEWSVLLSLILTIAIAVFFDINIRAENVRENTLRLHIIANSDEEKDQEIKLAVRDEILKAASEIYRDTDDISSAISATKEKIFLIEFAVERALMRANANYSGRCSVERFYFDTTKYEQFSMPEGEYLALTIRLGEAQGKNWWCVMYPNLCIDSCSKNIDEDTQQFISTEKSNKIEVRFKVVEIYQDIKKSFSKDSAPRYDKIKK